MRNLIILFLLAGIATGHAQVIHLDEARVTNSAKIITNGNNSSYMVLENYSGQFMKNPIGFMKENFDVKLFIAQMKGEEYESYRVEFRNRKGLLVADFDTNGKLLGTTQKFKNIPLPLTVSRDLVTNYKGWAMTRNIYTASGKGDAIDKELYKITMRNGKTKKNVKIIPDKPSRGLASN